MVCSMSPSCSTCDQPGRIVPIEAGARGGLPVPQGLRRRGGGLGGVDAELAVQVLDVRAPRLGAEDERGGDLLVGAAGADLVEDLPLAISQGAPPGAQPVPAGGAAAQV